MGDHNFQNKKDKYIRELTIADNLDVNLNILKEIFHFPLNSDFMIREVRVHVLDARGALVYLNGMTDEEVLEKNIIKPLINKEIEIDRRNSLEITMNNTMNIKGLKSLISFENVVNNILNGETVLVLDGYREIISINNIAYEYKDIEKPLSESIVYGPKEGFVESSYVNISLIRKQVKTEDLVTEALTVGENDMKTVYIMYIQDIADSSLIQEVKGRINKIKVDSLQQLTLLQQYIEDRQYSIIPTILVTERPDRAAAFLREGHVVLLLDTSPMCLVAPATFWAFFQTGEETYQRWAPGNFIRIIRITSLVIALLIPGFYIAITNFHSEMIPSDLLLSIAASRERMPFPALIEIILMETTFELLREAGLRIPTTIGPTIGIVGALILGQAAVEANIVSPILVIIVSITGLASFALPELGLSFVIRVWRFIFLFAGAFLGFYGIALALSASIAYASSIESFGVPFFSPMTPHYPSSKDLVTRPPLWKQLFRPMNIGPKNKVRKKSPEGGNPNG